MITSARSPKVRALRRLRHAKDRASLGFALVEGPHALASVIEAGALVDVVASGPGADVRHRALLVRAESAGGRHLRVARPVLAALTSSDSPPALLAAVRMPSHPDDKGSDAPLHLALSGIADPASLGAILQAAVACGVGRVTIDDGSVDPWNPKVVRASNGAGWWIPIDRHDLATTVADARSSGRSVVAIATDGPRVPEPRPGRALLISGPTAASLAPDMRCAPPSSPFPLGASVAITMILAGWSS